LIAFLAFAFPLMFYLGFPSSMWNFDGVACAAALELGQPAYYFHANHLIYGFLGFLFWKGIAAPLGMSKALPALQLFTSLLASAGLMGLFRLLQPLLKHKWSALLLTSSLAVTATFWVWSIEAQVYTLGFLALAWASFILLHHQSRRKYIYVGILQGAAVLGHLMHVLWTIPALYWMVDECRHLHISVHKVLRQYVASLGLVTLVPYILVVVLVIAPGRDLNRIAIWLKGSAGLTQDRHWAWHWSGWSGPWIWLRSTLPAIWGSFWPYGTTRVTPPMWILTMLSIILFVTLLVRGWGERSDRLSRFSCLWLGVYGILLSTWEPSTLCYRMTDILPLGILLALGLRTWRAPIQVLLVSLMLVSTLTLNLFTRIIPMHRTEQNATYQDTLSLSRITPANSLYVANNSLTWLYLLYFTGRTAWYTRSFEPNRLEAGIMRQKHSRPVYVQTESSWRQIQ
jgi:hypothetical protein